MPTQKQHDKIIAKLMRRPGVCAEVERIERDECEALDAAIEAKRRNCAFESIAQGLREAIDHSRGKSAAYD